MQKKMGLNTISNARNTLLQKSELLKYEIFMVQLPTIWPNEYKKIERMNLVWDCIKREASI